MGLVRVRSLLRRFTRVSWFCVERERRLSRHTHLRATLVARALKSARAGDGSKSLRASKARRPPGFFRYLSQNSFVVDPNEATLRVLPAAFAGGLLSVKLAKRKNENNFKRWITRLVRR